MTEEKIKSNSHIPTETILQDIADTEREVKDKWDELHILRRNPVENKVRIYMLEGGIGSRRAFINDLNEILEYRKKHG